MGPARYTEKFSPGTIVSRKNSEDCHIGTVIDNFVDIVINTGKRIEKVYVLWSDGTSEWISISSLLVVDH